MSETNKEELFAHYPEKTLERFKKFHKENPHIYESFKQLATKMRDSGRKKYSALAIIYTIRFNMDLNSSGDVFKINNDFVSIYARLLIYNDSSFDGFFELRKEENKGQKSQEQIRRENAK